MTNDATDTEMDQSTVSTGTLGGDILDAVAAVIGNDVVERWRAARLTFLLALHAAAQHPEWFTAAVVAEGTYLDSLPAATKDALLYVLQRDLDWIIATVAASDGVRVGWPERLLGDDH